MKKKYFNYFSGFTIFLFFILFVSLFKIIIIDSDKYKESLDVLTFDLVEGSIAPRGRIYDRNYNILVDNKAVPVIYYKKMDGVTAREEISLAYSILEHIIIDSSSLSITNFKEFWIADNPSLAKSKITSDEWLKLENRKLTYNDIYYLQLSRITNDDLSIYSDIDRDAAYIYYLMNKGYSYSEKVIKEDNVTDLEYAYIAENIDKLDGFGVKYYWKRVYPYGDVFRSVLGNISSISLEDKNYYLSKGYSLDDLVGSSYIEKQYESILRGTKPIYRIGNNNEFYLVEEGKRGNDIVLTIDINLQIEVEKILEEEMRRAKGEGATEYYDTSYVVIQKPNTGEILAMSGKNISFVNGKLKFYDYTPGILTEPMTVGSIVKGASMYVGYSNNAIKINEYMEDHCIKLYSVPSKCSWKNLGYINDIDALAMSSNVYQFKIAMRLSGFDYSYNKKFIINPSVFSLYRTTFNKFGLGVKTGIDLPIESIGNVGKSNSADLLLNFTIGQYDTYTTMQLSQYMNTIASLGKRYKPHLLKEVYFSSSDNSLGELNYVFDEVVLDTLDNVDYIKRIQQGFSAVIDYGTGVNSMGNINKPAGKTGTSESFLDTNGDGVVDTATVSKTFSGFAPYDNPKVTITVTSPDLINPNSKSGYISYANNRISRRISNLCSKIFGT